MNAFEFLDVHPCLGTFLFLVAALTFILVAAVTRVKFPSKPAAAKPPLDRGVS